MALNEFNKYIYKLSNRKRHYFLWKNKLSTKNTDYSKLTKEELSEKFNVNEFAWFKQWESSEEYQNLLRLLMQQDSLKDLIEVYKAVKEKALTGDDKAVKTFLILQKEFKKQPVKIIEENNNEEEEEDGLTLD